MDPIITPILMGIAAVAPIIGDLIGQAFASGDKERANKLMEDALAQYGPQLGAPTVEAITAHLERSALEKVQADPLAVEGQRQALAQMQALAREGPENIEFRAAIDAATRGVNQQANARDAALRMEAQARGAGAGTEFTTRAISNQAAADRLSGSAFDAAAEGRRQARQAMMDSAGLSGRMRDQSFDEESTRARAKDEVDRFNEMARSGAAQQDWLNRMNLATARGNAYGQAANVSRGNAAQTQQQWGNYGQYAGGAARQGAIDYEDWRKRQQQGAQP